MSTKVFISWSGDLSRKLGNALRNWLPSSLQYVKPYFTPEDIEKGAKWSTEIAKELESSNVGIICLTQDNTEKPWILFEAGALSKSLDKSRVCTLLFNLDPSEIKGPLTSFQSTRFVHDDFKRLVVTINNSAGESKLEGSVLDSVFDMWWPKLETQVVDIIKNHDNGGKKELRSVRDLLEEVLELTRMNASRISRPPRINERSIHELMELFDELMFVSLHRGSDNMDSHIIQRLDRPLRHLCLEAGVPELYERHRMRTHDLFGSFLEKERSAVTATDDKNRTLQK